MKNLFGRLIVAVWMFGVLCNLHSDAHAASDGVLFSKLRDLQIRPTGVMYLAVDLANPDPFTCGSNPKGARIYLPSNFPNYATAAQLIVQGYLFQRAGQLGLKPVGPECEITKIILY